MTTQKEIAATLDRAAARAAHVTEGASQKQVWFLAGLIAKAGETAEDVLSGATLTKRAASACIDQYLREEKLVATGLSRHDARVKMLGA